MTYHVPKMFLKAVESYGVNKTNKVLQENNNPNKISCIQMQIFLKMCAHTKRNET